MIKLSRFLLLGCFIAGSAHAVQGDFTISSIGSSNNTNSIFIETVQAASGTCAKKKKLFRLPHSDESADRLFSLALAAQIQGKKITINYDDSDSGCLQDGVLIKVFRLRK